MSWASDYNAGFFVGLGSTLVGLGAGFIIRKMITDYTSWTDKRFTAIWDRIYGEEKDAFATNKKIEEKIDDLYGKYHDLGTGQENLLLRMERMENKISTYK